MRLYALLGSTLLLAQSAIACPLEITATPRSGGDSFEVRWNGVAGATRYSVYELRQGADALRLVKQIPADGEQPRFVAEPTSTSRAEYTYLIIAEGQNGTACMATTSLTLPGDDRLAALTHKRIVPFAGSVRGANGSDFRTALTLRHYAFASGRIVFRPVGTTPSDSDPSLSYSFGDNNTAADLHWDDVMAAMGATGIGTLEILPNARQDGQIVVPQIHAHVYNVTPNGTFGSRVPDVAPSEWVRNEQQAFESLDIPAVQGNYRRNAGFRTLTEVSYTVTVTEPGQPSSSGPVRKAPANYTVFGSIDDLAGRAVSPAARVFIRFIAGDAIGFYTYTENATNDPTLVVRNPGDVNELTWGY